MSSNLTVFLFYHFPFPPSSSSFSPLLLLLPTHLQRSRRDFSNFDVDFISEKAEFTPMEREVVKAINQGEFEGFTFTNSEFHD